MPIATDDASISLSLPSGATVKVLFYGATIISWKCASSGGDGKDLQERLFVSSKAALDGSKPVRGGIPIVFPIFGPAVNPEHSLLSQHGFARSETWTLEETIMDRQSGVSVKLGYTPSQAILHKFPFPHKLQYVVTLSEHQLATDLTVENTGNDEMAFQALLHTYHRVPMGITVISDLNGLTYTNKTKDGSPREVEERIAVDTKSFTDYVYEHAGGKYFLSWDGTERVQIRATGFSDLVVWNPGPEKGAAMSDMEVGGWDNFICAEPGAVSSFVKLSSGQKWQGQQVLTIV